LQNEIMMNPSLAEENSEENSKENSEENSE
jgi:hypothetical protein